MCTFIMRIRYEQSSGEEQWLLEMIDECIVIIRK